MKTFLRETLSGWRAVYVAIVVAATIGAQVTHAGHYYLVAVLLTLPSAMGAIVGVYVAYGLVDLLVVKVQPGMSDGHVTDWVFTLTGPINVALFVGAAVGNIVLFRLFRDTRRARRLAPR